MRNMTLMLLNAGVLSVTVSATIRGVADGRDEVLEPGIETVSTP